MKIKAMLFAILSMVTMLSMPSHAQTGRWGPALQVDILPIVGLSPSEIHALAVAHGYPNAWPGSGTACTVGEERRYYYIMAPRPVVPSGLYLMVQYCI